MNAPDKLSQLLSLTREPFPASRKAYLAGSRDDLRVPLREVALTNGECVSLYDTSGPYTDPAAAIEFADYEPPTVPPSTGDAAGETGQQDSD